MPCSAGSHFLLLMPSSHSRCPLLLRHTTESVCVLGPSGPASVSRGGGGHWGEPGGQNTVCAVPGPLSDHAARVQRSHCSSWSSPFIPPREQDSYARVQWQGSGVGSGWPFDFKDIDRHFSTVVCLIIDLMASTGHAIPLKTFLKWMTPEVC